MKRSVIPARPQAGPGSHVRNPGLSRRIAAELGFATLNPASHSPCQPPLFQGIGCHWVCRIVDLSWQDRSEREACTRWKLLKARFSPGRRRSGSTDPLASDVQSLASNQLHRASASDRSSSGPPRDYGRTSCGLEAGTEVGPKEETRYPCCGARVNASLAPAGRLHWLGSASWTDDGLSGLLRARCHRTTGPRRRPRPGRRATTPR